MPAQIWLGQQSKLGASMVEILWWRTYSPPIWLLDHSTIRTTDLMGTSFVSVQMQVETALGSECDANKSVGFVAPYSSREMDDWIVKSAEKEAFAFEEIWRYGQHVNLDDLDIEGEGIWGTLGRVVGRRGLVIWKVRKVCGVGTGAGTTGGGLKGIMYRDW